MKNINKILASLIAIMFSVMLFDGCKKGEEDPFLSLRSRDSRIEGTWKLVSVEKSVTSTDNTSTTTVTTKETDVESLSYNGSSLTETNKNTLEVSGSAAENETDKTVSTYSLSVTINEDNTYTYDESKTVTSFCTADLSDCTPVTVSTASTVVAKDSGDWFWLNSEKNKSEISTGAPYFWGKLIRLSNKELTIQGTIDESTKTTSTGFSNEVTEKGTYTYKWEKQE